MKENEEDLVARVHREAWEYYRQHPPPPTLHYTELPPARPGDTLAEGHEGRHVLIKGREIIGIWDTQKEAFAAADRLFPLQPSLVHQIQERERILRTEYNRLCTS
jgi:hypothetical protein